MGRPVVEITEEMIKAAEALVPDVAVRRTVVSPVDTLGGILGEFAFAHWLTGTWKLHEVGRNKGQADLFGLIEVKTSIYPFKESLNLVIREDYGAKFKDVYVQNIIDVDDARTKQILPGTRVIVCGFADHGQATSKPAQAMTMRGGGQTPYRVFKTPISELQPMTDFRPYIEALAKANGIEIAAL